MLRLSLCLAFALTWLVSPAQAGDVDAVVAAYLEAIGGEERWRSLKSSELTGTMKMQGMDLPLTITSRAPNHSRVEMQVMGKAVVNGFDGTTVWTINPFMGGTEPVKGTPEESAEAAKQSFQNEFVDLGKKGHTVTLVGSAEVDGAACHEVLMKTKAGEETRWCFDSTGGLPLKQSATVPQGPMKGKVLETFFSDYKDFDGYVMATRTESKVDGETMQITTIQSATFNIPLDDSRFAMP